MSILLFYLTFFSVFLIIKMDSKCEKKMEIGFFIRKEELTRFYLFLFFILVFSFVFQLSSVVVVVVVKKYI